MLRRLWNRRAGRKRRAWMRLGLRPQIAALGLGGAALTGATHLVGLRLEAEARRAADESAALEPLVAGATEGFLEARQLATEFLQKHDEKTIARHDQVMARLGETLDTVQQMIEP